MGLGFGIHDRDFRKTDSIYIKTLSNTPSVQVAKEAEGA
jgi:hypothetical protein